MFFGSSISKKVSRVALLTVVLIAPLKLGLMLLPGVPQGSFDGWFGLLVSGWPPAFFALIAGFLLLLSVTAYGVPENLIWKNPLGKLLVLWLLLPVVTLIGFVNADSLESPIIELEYTLALAAFAGAAAINLSGNDSKFRQQMFNMIAVGTLLTAILGVHQYFWGFDDLKKFIEVQESIYHVKIPPELKARAYDVRTYASFTFASALAGMFCLAGMLTVCRACKWGRNFEPAAISQKLFGVAAFILCAGIFLSTKGRSAFLAVTVSAAVCGWLLVKSRRLKIIIAAVAMLVVIGGAIYIEYAGRGFSSMTERVGYLKSSWEMLVDHPICGDGWGDFTFHHALNKSFGNDELAKDPHNLVAAFAAQCGLPGLVVTLGLIIGSIYLSGRQMLKNITWENGALFFAMSAFALHVLMDLDWQVPGLMCWWCVIMFLAAMPDPAVPVSTDKISSRAGKIVRDLFIFMLALLTVGGGWHWLVSDMRFGKMLQAAGQEVGIVSPRSSGAYEVDILAGKALQIAPYSHSIYIAWGNDALYRRNYVQAEKRFLKALEMVPRSHVVHERLGEIYEYSGQLDKARIFYQRANELFPYKKIFADKLKGIGDE